MEEYKLVLDVQNAPSGSERLAQEQGTTVRETGTQQAPTQRQQRRSLMDIIEERVGAQRLDTTKKVFGTTAAVGYIALDLYQQDLNFRGDSNRNLRINETKKWVGVVGATTTLLASGNYIGATIFLGYTALNLAKENRELINAREIDSYRTSYYQNRLVHDVSGRSR